MKTLTKYQFKNCPGPPCTDTMQIIRGELLHHHLQFLCYLIGHLDVQTQATWVGKVSWVSLSATVHSPSQSASFSPSISAVEYVCTRAAMWNVGHQDFSTSPYTQSPLVTCGPRTGNNFLSSTVHVKLRF